MSKEIAKTTRNNLYMVSHHNGHFTHETKKTLGLRIPVRIILQDREVAQDIPELGLEEILVNWEPGLTDGPTSSKLAVVDYNSDSGILHTPVKWNKDEHLFLNHQGQQINPISLENLKNVFEFHQVSVWAIVQYIIEYFESPWSMGRSLPWGFEGNRLIIVPHAGYGANAYYDRNSKSLQFYYYDSDKRIKYTCESLDIIAHETGHAILDGIRPYYMEDSSLETAAFHEFVGDFTAILIALSINEARHIFAGLPEDSDNFLTNIGEEFAKYANHANSSFLRSARNEETKISVGENPSSHTLSQVLTGAMIEIFELMFNYHLQKNDPEKSKKRPAYHATRHIQTIALQALDFLPPVDVSFQDYARAIIRVFDLDDPENKTKLRAKIKKVFSKRKITRRADIKDLDTSKYSFTSVSYRADIFAISRSRAAAYRFLHDNRGPLRIPIERDIIIADLYTNQKLDRSFRSLSPQFVLQYIWKESILLNGKNDKRDYSEYEGSNATLLCGGTLVFDQQGTIIYRSQKQSSEERKNKLKEHIENRINNGMVAFTTEADAPVIAKLINGSFQFSRTARFHFHDDEEQHKLGGRE